MIWCQTAAETVFGIQYWSCVRVFLCVKDGCSFLTPNFSEISEFSLLLCLRQSSKGSHTNRFVASLWESSLTSTGKTNPWRILMAVLFGFGYIILSFKNSQEHPLVPGHQTTLLALDTLESMAGKSERFYWRRCSWCTWNISLKTNYPSSEQVSGGLRCLVAWIVPRAGCYIFCCCCVKSPQPCLTNIFIKCLLKHVFFKKKTKHTHTQRTSSESSNLTPYVLLRFPKHWGLENMFPISSHLSVLVFYSAPCCGGPDPSSLQGTGAGRGVRPC